MQLDGTTDEVMPLGDLAAKWEAFGWTVLECDGHDLEALDFCISVADGAVGAPTVIIANTVKGARQQLHLQRVRCQVKPEQRREHLHHQQHRRNQRQPERLVFDSHSPMKKCHAA